MTNAASAARPITAKFSARCTGCGHAIDRGDTVLWSKNTKGVRCVACAATPEEMVAVNPWTSLHLQGEMVHTGGEYTGRKARSVVLGQELDRARPAERCTCGGFRHYRATVGAMLCTNGCR